MIKRSCFLLTWSLLGVPSVFAVLSFFEGKFFQNYSTNSLVPVTVWCVTLIPCLWSGVRSLLAIVDAGRVIRTILGIAYACGMYVLTLMTGVITMFVSGGGHD